MSSSSRSSSPSRFWPARSSRRSHRSSWSPAASRTPGRGCGKSTVANIVSGLLQPWSGEVLFDGQARDAIPREVLSASLGKVDQSILLFSGTVIDNIRFWDDAIPASSAVLAAEDACIATEIQAKPDGFGHRLAEGGRNMSGGQRQRLEIARVLATNPSIV